VKARHRRSDGADVARSRLERATRLLLDMLTGADPEGQARAACALYAAKDAGLLLDRLASRPLRARKRAKGEARDRTLAALRIVLAVALRARARPHT